MATLDPRLLELLETLVASKADWLVFELIEGINAGIVFEETPDDLAFARLVARREREFPRSAEWIGVSPESRTLEGDEQVVWAARYIGRRLKEVLQMMDVATERLNMLVDRRVDARIEGSRSRVMLGLRDGDEVVAVSAEKSAVAQSAVFDLLAGLASWVGEATGGRQTL